MTAKHKLNSAHLMGAVVIASALGLLTQQWWIALAAFGVILVSGLQDGSLRL